jgi:hypothetical protein
MLNNKSFLVVLSGGLFALLLTGCIGLPEHPLTNTGSLQFKIQDQSQNPLSGAKVVAEVQPDGQLKVSGITDTNGTITFNDIAAGEYEFSITRFDYFPARVAVTVTAGKTELVNISLIPENVPITIPATAVRVCFSELVAQPQIYNGQYIIIDGYWFDGFEMAALAQRLEPSVFAPGNLKPGGALIWIKGGLREEVRQQLYLQSDNPTGYPAHFGKVRLTGKLEYGGQYGHLDSYQYQLYVYDSEMLPWAPPAD